MREVSTDKYAMVVSAVVVCIATSFGVSVLPPVPTVSHIHSQSMTSRSGKDAVWRVVRRQAVCIRDGILDMPDSDRERLFDALERDYGDHCPLKAAGELHADYMTKTGRADAAALNAEFDWDVYLGSRSVALDARQVRLRCTVRRSGDETVFAATFVGDVRVLRPEEVDDCFHRRFMPDESDQ